MSIKKGSENITLNFSLSLLPVRFPSPARFLGREGERPWGRDLASKCCSVVVKTL